ncbi:MaoC family dehydratase [Janibacter sp. YIM B02568]|uniref:MaoC family dehydratase n=1 Tax=Janibacter endophyticus TaxID=2806261 RepID=UPI0019528874|nr:MaoC family dehydratase [Janibacter endophyticus]MBM6545414.1 MaoC family dehydratase [Janibacter endophyticus]
MITISGLDGLRASAGTHLGISRWHEVTQEAIDAFARTTGDPVRIHLDLDAARDAGFPDTIAHGLYTLSLGPGMFVQLVEVVDVAVALNYGFDKVRWLTPVVRGQRVRMSAEIVDANDVDGGVRLRVRQTFLVEGSDSPVCVADALHAWYDVPPTQSQLQEA